jgi:PmbA protein
MTTATYLLRSETELLDAAALAVAHARTLGVDQATVVANEVSGINIGACDGEIVSSIRDGHQSLAVTVFDGGRIGNADVAQLAPDAIRTAVERAVTIARQVQPDPQAGLPDPAWLALDGADVAMFAPSGLGAQALGNAALALDRVVCGSYAPPGVRIRADSAGASAHEMQWARVTTQGFSRTGRATEYSLGTSVIAEGADGMAMNGWSDTRRRHPDLSSTDIIGARAAANAIAAIGARSLTTRTAPVLLDAPVAGSLVGELATALNGMAQHQGTTFLCGAAGSSPLAAHLDLIEDAFEPYGLASSAWDSDGIAAPRRHVVRGGRVEGYFLNAYTARLLGFPPTGNADGINNLIFSSRDTRDDDDRVAMIRRLGEGLLVTGFIGGGLDRASGAWSKAATGFWVTGGEIAWPVRDITVAGDMTTMLSGIRAVGSDTYQGRAIRSGSILLDSLRIAGR